MNRGNGGPTCVAVKGGQKNRQDVDNSNIGRIGQSPEEKTGQEKTAEKVNTEGQAKFCR